MIYLLKCGNIERYIILFIHLFIYLFLYFNFDISFAAFEIHAAIAHVERKLPSNLLPAAKLAQLSDWFLAFICHQRDENS